MEQVCTCLSQCLWRPRLAPHCEARLWPHALLPHTVQLHLIAAVSVRCLLTEKFNMSRSSGTHREEFFVVVIPRAGHAFVDCTVRSAVS